jgi:hypothetical protein
MVILSLRNHIDACDFWLNKEANKMEAYNSFDSFIKKKLVSLPEGM